MKRYFKYWGKARRGEDNTLDYHLLPYHCLDVAAVGVEFLKGGSLLRRFCERLGMEDARLINVVAFLCVVHDIGKFAEGFQNLRPDLYSHLNNKVSSASYIERHWSLGYRFLCENIQEIFNGPKDFFLDSFACWLAASAGHHGRPPENQAFPHPVVNRFSQQGFNDALDFMKEARNLFLGENMGAVPDENKEALSILSWDLAGLVVLADWIGSNEAWFNYRQDSMPLEDYWKKVALPLAKKAIKNACVSSLSVSPCKTVQEMFPVIIIPTSLQSEIESIELPSGPKLFIIEDLTGSGKTEAALVLAHRIMASGEADGIYFGLPTMATANAMHGRVEAVYKKFYEEALNPSLILAHSMSRQYLALEKNNPSQNNFAEEECAEQTSKSWLFDSKKKTFLADIGVGTIDQALLGVLPVRHQALRLLGMQRKVLVVDEVHAYDSYTNKLLCALLEFHSARGGNAILLSATLPQTLRKDFINAFAAGLASRFSGDLRESYPLITQVSGRGFLETPVSSPGRLHKKIKVVGVHELNDVLALIKTAVQEGKCVCWIRNTVQDAMDAYDLLDGEGKESSIILFHARFALGDRLSIEQSVVASFGPKSSAQTRQGKLVVATQVAEQSLDLDFDFMVSDLAPIDLIIQRAGRLCRHRRDALGNVAEKEQRPAPEMAIYMPTIEEKTRNGWYSDIFPKAAKVYAHHGQLWLTAKWLVEHKSFSMPKDAREMIEYVYGEGNQLDIPEVLQAQENKAGGRDRAQAGVAQYNALKVESGYMADMLSWPDDENVSTRSGEPTTLIRLALWKDSELVPYFNNQWMLSQVSVYRSLVAFENKRDQKAIDEAKSNMPDKGKYCVVVPLKENGNGLEGFACDGQSRQVKVYYDRKRGLRVERQGD